MSIWLRGFLLKWVYSGFAPSFEMKEPKSTVTAGHTSTCWQN